MLKSNQNSNGSTSLVSGTLFMLKAVSISYIISLVLLFASALIATYQAMSDTGICILANVVTALGTAFSGFMAGRHFSGKGLLFGAGCGAIYTVILCIVGNIISASLNFGISFLTALLIGVLCGAVGGIAGINTKRTRRR